MQTPYPGLPVLVTGASGFIGSALCVRLRDLGAEVHAVSRTLHEVASVRWHVGNLTSREFVQSLFSRVRPTIVFHLAGETRAARDLALVPLAFDSNLASSVNVMTSAVASGTERVVLAGSQEEPDESALEATPNSPYAASKWAATQYSRMFCSVFGLSTISLRIFMVYGPGQRDLNKLIPHVILNLLKGIAPTINSGDRNVDWIHVGDVVNAFVLAGVATKIKCDRIDVGSGRLATIREIVDSLANLVASGTRPVYRGVAFARPLEKETVANVDKTYLSLGWRPQVSIQDGLRETVDWLRARQRES